MSGLSYSFPHAIPRLSGARFNTRARGRMMLKKECSGLFRSDSLGETHGRVQLFCCKCLQLCHHMHLCFFLASECFFLLGAICLRFVRGCLAACRFDFVVAKNYRKRYTGGFRVLCYIVSCCIGVIEGSRDRWSQGTV